MIQKTLAKRYAEALLSCAEKAGAVEAVETQILEVAAAVRGSKELRAALAHPGIPLSRKREVLRAVFRGRIHDLLADFLDLLLRRRRADVLSDIAEMYDRMADRSRGVVKVQVRAFQPLSDVQRAALQERLAKRLQRKVEIDVAVDPSIRGGMAVRIGDTVIDGTLSGRLRALRESLMEGEAGLWAASAGA